MFLAEEFPHNIAAVFCVYLFAGFDSPMILRLFLMGSRGFSWVRIMGSQNVMGSGYGSNTSVLSSSK
jgi:hypothetical protein